MTSLAADKLKSLSEGGRSAADPQVSDLLERLAVEIEGRMQTASPHSFEFFNSVSDSLIKLNGPANHAVRIQALLNTAQYFYVLGRPFEALKPAAAALSLAAEVNDKPLSRRASMTLGAMYADTGNISGAIECYSRALEILAELDDPAAEWWDPLESTCRHASLSIL